ncbi:MAG TPA: hypothetical protein VGI54_12110, partial [Solirubrobacteraceae bacterium]
MLAYVFWHRPTGEAATYEDALRAFHAALAADPPPGFHRSLAVRLDAAPWLAGTGTAYEDWYLVADWAALGTLNEAAVSGARRSPHDAVAGRAGHGAGAVYAPLAGAGDGLAGDRAAWLAKPAGTSYGDWLATLTAMGTEVWQRQMTLGPAPEFVVFGDAPG